MECCWRDDVELFVLNKYIKRIEEEADRFASAFLMPRSSFIVEKGFLFKMKSLRKTVFLTT
ncbi:hypothetical protein M769_0117165 [Bacillus haynesii]|nr:hypothetical protein M769_0117165 [Bacillus haynesii]